MEDVAGQCPGPLGQSGPLRRDGGAQRGGVAQQRVGGGEGVDHLADHEPAPLLALGVEAEPADGVAGHRRRPQVALEHPAVDRVLPPGRIGEAAVAPLGLVPGHAPGGRGQLAGEAEPGGSQTDRMAGGAGGQPDGRRHLGPAQRHQRHRPGQRGLGLVVGGGREVGRGRHDVTLTGGRAGRYSRVYSGPPV